MVYRLSLTNQVFIRFKGNMLFCHNNPILGLIYFKDILDPRAVQNTQIQI